MLNSPLEVAHVGAHGVSRSDHGLIVLSKILDASVIAGALMTAATFYRSGWDPRYGLAALLAAILFFLFAEIAGLYRPWRGETLKRQFFQVLFVWVETFFILLLLAYAFKTSDYYSRIAVGIWLVATPLLLSGWRAIARKLFFAVASRSGSRRNAVVWGTGELGEQLARKIDQSPWLGLNLTAYVRDDQTDCSPAEQISQTELGKLESLELQARRGDFDILYIALPTTARERITDLLDRLADTTVTVYMVPDYFTTSLFHGKWSNLEGIPLISVYDTPFWGVDGWVKRAEDIVLSSLFLLMAAIPMLLIAAAVKLTSNGPVLFKQRRYGIDGNEITVWKFRTMRVCEDGHNVPQAKRNDPRVTPVGNLLRRTSLDELPQFINVLLGDMSIVGPRPHAVAHNELYRSQVKGYMLRHKVRPGITGWAQINGWRGETDTLDKMTKRVEHDLWYIRNWSLWLDLKIVLLTALRGLVSKTAY
jgi:putative colanic acid biosynthesis UDP-glucose lipid carrier transferase